MKSKKTRKYITFGAPTLGKEEIREVAAVLRSGWIGTGTRAKQFEHDVNRYVGSKHACALNSCTAGLHLSLVAMGIGKGDEVITTPMTFCASANAIIHAGATPVFVDIDRDTLNIDEKKIEKAITKRTKAIMPVHMAGRPCEMDEIWRIARKHKLAVIEDAAHALGAAYRGKKIGAQSDATCFSFYATKNITTGEGGMVVTNDKELADRIRVLALHGMSKDAWRRYGSTGYMHYEVVVPGFKYNLTDIAAGIGVQQLKKIGAFNKRRKEIWKYFDKQFRDLPVTLPPDAPRHMVHARHLYTLLIDKERTGMTRDEFLQALHDRGIGSGVHFRPVHLHEYYRNTYGYTEGAFPEAEYIGDRTVSLPFSPRLTDKEVEYVAKSVREILTAKHHD